MTSLEAGESLPVGVCKRGGPLRANGGKERPELDDPVGRRGKETLDRTNRGKADCGVKKRGGEGDEG